MKLLKNVVAWGLMVCLTTVSFGCSCFRSSTQTLNLACDQEGVLVHVNGQQAACPGQIAVKRDNGVSVTANREGYKTYYRSIDSHMNGSGVWDIVGGVVWLVPFIGLASPGAYSLDETNIHIDLFPETRVSQN